MFLFNLTPTGDIFVKECFCQQQIYFWAAVKAVGLFLWKHMSAINISVASCNVLAMWMSLSKHSFGTLPSVIEQKCNLINDSMCKWLCVCVCVVALMGLTHWSGPDWRVSGSWKLSEHSDCWWTRRPQRLWPTTFTFIARFCHREQPRSPLTLESKRQSCSTYEAAQLSIKIQTAPDPHLGVISVFMAAGRGFSHLGTEPG